ncbi:hypothetical protein QQF64_036120 [Cirrhinus molitorella]|uniref:Transposase n=1 Tax=Cirrhinus molitorella TaxID=172907 RepID=A0ABR3NHM2_9TELE
MFVFFDGKCFREELLGLLPLEGHKNWRYSLGKISAFFKDNGLDMKRVCMLVTDGAPSMTGKVNGLAARWSTVAPQLISLHCTVHQAVLCAKLSGALKTTMDSVMATINFIRSTSSLQHSLFQVKLDLFANDLSTGRMLHFPTLRKCISSPAQITDVMTDFIAMLKNDFAGRLDGLDLPTEVAVFVRDPFTVAIEGDFSARAKKVVPSIEGKFTLELVDMQLSVTMAQELSTNGLQCFGLMSTYSVP